MAKLGLRVLPLVAPLFTLAACGDVVARAIDDGPTDGGSADASIADAHVIFPTDGALVLPDGAPLGDAPSFCAGNGPSIPLPMGDECTGDLGGKLFRFAACSCTTTEVSGKLQTDSFDPTIDGGGAGGDYASIAANGAVSTNSQVSLGGNIYAGGGAPALTLGGNGTVARDVRAGGDVVDNGIFQIAGDLYAAGNVSIQSGSLSVVGKVHLPSGNTASGVTTGGGIVNEAVTVAPPCDCGSPLDVPAIVAPFKQSNDDASAGVTATALDNPGAAVALPCGRYYFDGIQGGDVTLNLSGRTAIFVGGDLDVQGSMAINLAPGAEVDLFIAGNFSLTGSAAFGAVTSPSKVRVYVGGTMFNLSAQASVGANLYAPNADLELSSNFEMSGAIYGKSLEFSGDFTIHYDESVVELVGCEPPGGACQTCNDCAGATPSCIGGTCGPCVTDDDCCAPLQCDQGKCVQRIR